MIGTEDLPPGVGKSWIVLETLIYMLRENNILKRSR